MRRFLFPLLILTLALLLPACAPNNAPKQDPEQWGNLRVTLEGAAQTEKQWSAKLAIKNPTDKMQVMQYQGPARYTMVVTRDEEEVLRQNFDALDPSKPEVLNLTAGVTKSHPVVWTYRNNAGQPVEPGTYQISVTLNAITTMPNPNPKAGEPAQQIVQPKTVGPVTVTVK